MNADDATWEYFGRSDPYFGVLADPRYRREAFDDRAREEFFASGESQVAHLLATLEHSVGPLPARAKALDFGCGVGRLAIPLARRFAEVVGVDISPSMIAEARRNAGQAASCSPMRWCETLDDLAAERGSFDFVNTMIVLQHMAPPRGLAAVQRMVELLACGGGGVIQFTYAQRRYAAALGRPSRWEAWQARLKHAWGDLHRRLSGRTPRMQMNAYPVDQLMFLLQSLGVTRFACDFTDHGGYLGMTIFFRKA